MTDKLIEQIEASRSGKGPGPWTRDMEASILADAEVIKSAEALAGLDCADVIERALQEGAIADKWTWVFEDTLTELKSALTTFHQAQARAALEEKSDEIPK